MTVLADTATAVGPMIRSRVSGLPPEVRHLCGLHFGWWNDEGAALATHSTDKCVRPALVLLACQAVGGSPEAARPAAVSVELVHNASLLHDDIIDHDGLRRGRPALWTLKGVPAGILAGDALFFAAVQALTEAPDAGRTLPVLLACVQMLIEGEYLDVLLETASDVSEHRVLDAVAAKTAEMLACACELGAIAGGAGPGRAHRLREFGRNLGLAFQHVDDVLGIWGQEHRTGKPTWSDLRACKVSLPVAAAMAGTTAQAKALRDLYRQGAPLSDDDCRRAAQLIEQSGALAATADRARRHTADALHHLALAHPAPVPGAELTALAEHLVGRDH
jgi:geranylgeranyl diphosphate synthase type I